MSEEYLIPQFIIEYLQKSRNTKTPKNLASVSLRKHKTPEIEKWFKENEVTAGYLWKYFVYYGVNKFSFRECPICGNRLNFKTILTKPNVKYCSLKCSNSSKEVREKYKQTCLEKYGVENPSQSKEVREKIKLHSEEKEEKRKQTCLKKYGVKNPAQLKEVQEKMKQTNLERYGVKFTSQARDVQEKMKQTNLKKYGVEFISHSKEIVEKRFQTQRSNHWETFCLLLKEKDIIPLFSKEEYINDTGRKFKCLCCNEEFESEGANNYEKIHTNKDGSYTTLQIHCIHCPNCVKSKYSKKEKEVVSFIQSVYNGITQENIKGLLPSRPQMEIDIYLPKLKLGIEFDGNYWHSTEEVKKRDTIKNTLCEQRGITLLRIKESDWDNNPQSVKETLLEAIKSKFSSYPMKNALGGISRISSSSNSFCS